MPSQDSLCILDELGRGTATFDGTAIAHAVVEHLVSQSRCRAIFATHYHSLVFDWSIDPRVALGHMQCVVSSGGNGDSSGGSGGNGSGNGSGNGAGAEEVTFLYHLGAGSSPRSYGINVARLAALPAEVIELATRQSAEFEATLAAAGSVDVGVVAGAAAHQQTSLAATAARDALLPYFSRLVSLAGSGLPQHELAEAARELWRRLGAAVQAHA